MFGTAVVNAGREIRMHERTQRAIARLVFVREAYPDSILVPIFSTLLVEDERCVFVEQDGHAQLRTVAVGIVQGSQVQITSGLSAGDRLIVTGQHDVRDGEPVNVHKVLN